MNPSAEPSRNPTAEPTMDAVDCVPDESATQAQCTSDCGTVSVIGNPVAANGGAACDPETYDCQDGDGDCTNGVAYLQMDVGARECPDSYDFVRTFDECDFARLELGISEWNGAELNTHVGRKPYCWVGGGGAANFNEYADFGTASGLSTGLICSSTVYNYYYLVKGDDDNGCEEPNGCDTVVALKSEVHAVRCCSDTSIQDWRQQPGCSVWIESDIWQEGCQELDWDDANDFCASKGARLCTKAEIETPCADETGCRFDWRLIWSSTPFIQEGNS